MISAWELYLWTRLDYLPILAFAFVAANAGAVFWGICPPSCAIAKKISKRMLPVTCLFVVLAIIIPNKKDAALIWFAPQLATIENAELLKGEAAEIYTMAKDALKESIGVKPVEE